MADKYFWHKMEVYVRRYVLWCAIEMKPILGLFWPFLLVRPVSAKTATFWPRSHQNARLTAQRDGT